MVQPCECHPRGLLQLPSGGVRDPVLHHVALRQADDDVLARVARRAGGARARLDEGVEAHHGV
eukprot:4420041-Prymnesium_polylepis.1